MNTIKGATASEKRLVLAIQKAVGAVEDGYIGTQTLAEIASKLKADAFPVTLKMYELPVIIGNDIQPLSQIAPLAHYPNSMTGSFTYPRAKLPCSILITNGNVVQGSSCHAHLNKPETVLYRTNKGKLGIKRVTYTTELPEGIKWAVGGMGLLGMYNPVAEGFTGEYADVLRKTSHCVLGVKGGKLYGILIPDKTAPQVDVICKEKFKLESAIMLDGGGLAAMNGAEAFAKRNAGLSQGYAIKFL